MPKSARWGGEVAQALLARPKKFFARHRAGGRAGIANNVDANQKTAVFTLEDNKDLLDVGRFGSNSTQADARGLQQISSPINKTC